MSPAAPSGIPPSPPHLDRVRDFWRRVREGRDIDDLWSKFAADARPLWAMMNKLTPARRILLLVALACPVPFGACNSSSETTTASKSNLSFIAALRFLVVLSLERADKVAMKRDLEIARLLVPSESPVIPDAGVAFRICGQNSVSWRPLRRLLSPDWRGQKLDRTSAGGACMVGRAPRCRLVVDR